MNIRIFLLSFAAITVLAFLSINIAAIYTVGPYGWDDGSITLAFSKTLAETARMSLTANSEIVEGFSSLLFVFLMSALHYIFNFDFNFFILASQIVALIFVIATGIVLYSVILNLGVGKPLGTITVTLFLLLPMFTTEVTNGMEMTLFAFLITLYYVNFDKNIHFLMLLTPLILLTRFEAIFYIGLSVLIFFLVCERKKRTFFLGVYTLTIFLIITVVRWNYFGELVPNTILAKMNPPYSSEGFGSLNKKILGGFEFFKVSFWLLAPILFLLFTPLRKYLKNDVGVILIFSYAVFSLVAGKNLGYDGRMFLSILPVMILVIFSIVAKIKPGEYVTSNSSLIRLSSADKNIVALVVALTAITGSHVLNRSLHKHNINRSLTGGVYQNRLPSEKIMTTISGYLNLENQYDFGVTPENYRLTGLAVDRIRKSIDRDVISFMVPDVGGLGLCCSKIQVVDSALLTNRDLAKIGYEYFDDYLAKTLPDVIETHGIWSEVTKIYESKNFENNYTPIVFENNFLWVRNDILSLLNTSALLRKKRTSNLSFLQSVRYNQDIEQLIALEKFSDILVFDFIY